MNPSSNRLTRCHTVTAPCNLLVTVVLLIMGGCSGNAKLPRDQPGQAGVVGDSQPSEVGKSVESRMDADKNRIDVPSISDGTFWGEAGGGQYGTKSLNVGHNFHRSHADLYPEYGVVTHTVSDDGATADNYQKLFAAALKICADDFGDAFKRGTIWQYGHRPGAPPDETSRSTPQNFTPKYVIVLLIAHTKIDSPKIAGEASGQRVVAGAIVSANSLFLKGDSAIDIVRTAQIVSGDQVDLRWSESRSLDDIVADIVKQRK